MKSANTSLSLFAALLLAGFSMPASADCAYPKAPANIPNGSTATKDEMIATMATFKQYNADVDTYMNCLDEETAARSKDAAAATAVVQIKAIQQKKRASVEEERQAKLGAFNEQVRAFKARAQ